MRKSCVIVVVVTASRKRLCYRYKQEAKSASVPPGPKEHHAASDSAGDSSLADKTDDVTPDFECNIPREEVDLIMSAETRMSGSDYNDDFERHSTSSDEREMPNVPPWLREAVK